MKTHSPSIFLVLIVFGCSSSPSSTGWSMVESEGHNEARSECAFTEAGGKFYLLGGRKIQSVDVYDPVTNSWSQGADAPMEFHHFQAVTYNGKVYVMGALTGDYPREDPVPVIHIYDPLAEAWSLGDSIPVHRRRGAAGVTVVDGQFYVACGIQDGHYDGHVTWLDRYDPEDGTWEELADAPRARDHFQLTVIGDKLYAAGGRRSSAKINHVFDLTIPEVDVYDMTTGEWEGAVTVIPTERAGCTSLAFGDQFVVIGGESASTEEGHYDAEVFDVSSGQWYTSSQLIDGRHGTQAILYQDNIYLAAGSGNRGGGPELTTMEIIGADQLFSR